MRRTKVAPALTIPKGITENLYCPNGVTKELLRFASSSRGTCQFKHVVNTRTNDPIYKRPYPLPYAMRNQVKEEVDKMLKAGIVESSVVEGYLPINFGHVDFLLTYFALLTLCRTSSMRGIGLGSNIVSLFSALKSTQKRIVLSFFRTKTTGAAYGLSHDT
jgi:hypothetical protein